MLATRVTRNSVYLINLGMKEESFSDKYQWFTFIKRCFTFQGLVQHVLVKARIASVYF